MRLAFFPVITKRRYKMTQKLFYEDQYIKEFTAEILNVIESNGSYHIQLDKTAFFPGGGGQPCDTGFIEDSAIIEVYEKNGLIYHVSNKKPLKIHRVKCSIDWNSRFDGMQQHLGQHILSAAFLKLFGANTVSFHLGKDICTTDIDKLLSDDELEQAEVLANRYIFEDYPVEFLTPSKAELKKLSLRRVPDIKEETLRVVRVEDIDTTACCGLHPKSTLETQILKIRRKEKAKGNLRVEYICGKRAVDDCLSKYKFSSTLCRKLNCNEEEALIRIENITSEYSNLSFENKNLKSQLADFQVQNILNSCDKVSNISIVKDVFVNADMKYVNTLASKLTSYENAVVLYGLKNEGMAYLLFMCSKNIKALNMNDLLKDAITLIDGKGGGSSLSAQGGGKATNNLESAVDYAFSKVKSLLK
jgi:alanyl-tRNA synthetase